MKTKYFWITRDGPHSRYGIWLEKPQWSKSREEWGDDIHTPMEYVGTLRQDAGSFEIIFNVNFNGGPRSITKRRLSK